MIQPTGSVGILAGNAILERERVCGTVMYRFVPKNSVQARSLVCNLLVPYSRMIVPMTTGSTTVVPGTLLWRSRTVSQNVIYNIYIYICMFMALIG
jgi:hypothetical protein